MKKKDTRRLCLRILVACCILGLPATGFASVTAYTDLATFNSALVTNGYVSTVENFDSEFAGTVYPDSSSIGHVSFRSFGPPDLIVTDDFATTSGTNYLGMDSVGLANQFIGGYTFDMDFASSHAVGFNVVTGEVPNLSIFDDDIHLDVAGSGSVLLDVDDLQGMVGGTDSVFFLGLIDTTNAFTTASISYDAAAVGTITYNIDDIRTAGIPEPGSAMLVLVALGATFVRRNRQRS